MSKAPFVTDADFEAEVLKSPIPVLCDFYAAWCGPCQMMAPVLDEIATKHAAKLKTVKLDTDANMTTASRYGIMSIPTLIVFKGGQEAARLVGYMPLQTLEARLAAFLA
jgi:thioredoxin 1